MFIDIKEKREAFMKKVKMYTYLGYGLFVFECICLCNLWLGITNAEYGLKKDMGLSEGIGIFEVVFALLWLGSIFIHRYVVKKTKNA